MKILLASFCLVLLFFTIILLRYEPKRNILLIKSIDTVKMSRDLAREKSNDVNFDKVIDQQVNNIAKTGANYIAIATPYDDEFSVFLKKWVSSARKYKLKVWFRGNWSGWEGWFDYPSINKEEHLSKTRQYILDNKDLFENGDIFTSCTECENGKLSDPRQTNDIDGFKDFLISQYLNNQKSFKMIDKEVYSNYFSMNFDVAKLIMDKRTTEKLGGIVVIDHYTATPEDLHNDIIEIAEISGGKIVLGEFGVPIIDINGNMTEEEQSQWINRTFELMLDIPYLIGINYWTNTGASTEIWDYSGSPKLVLNIIKKYYID